MWVFFSFLFWGPLLSLSDFAITAPSETFFVYRCCCFSHLTLFLSLVTALLAVLSLVVLLLFSLCFSSLLFFLFMAAEPRFGVEIGAKYGGSAAVPSLPPPCPKSPPEYPDLYGKRRELAKVQMLEREISFLEEELKSVERLPPASRFCKEVADFVVANSDPLIPTNRKNRRSCGFWRWLCGIPCFSFSCCCSKRSNGQKPSCCCDCDTLNCCSCPKMKCSCSCSCPKLDCCKLPSCSCNCCKCGIPKLSCNCCSCGIPSCSCCKFSCPKLDCCKWRCCCPKWTCSFPKCVKVCFCSNCTKTCCNPCCFPF